MALLDLQSMVPSGGYDDCHDRYDDDCCGSEISLLLCGG
jgi:hypothetical protein